MTYTSLTLDHPSRVQMHGTVSNQPGSACSVQAAKLAESMKMLEEEERAMLATSALHKRDLVLKLRQVLTCCSTALCLGQTLSCGTTVTDLVP